MDALKINTGMLSIPVERDGEATGTLKFNPSDVSFINRYFAMVAKFSEGQKTISEKIAVFRDNSNPDEAISLAAEACKIVREAIDAAFGAGTSDMLFGECYSIEVYAQFFEGITPIINANRTNKTAKYTQQADSGVME